MLAVNNSKNPVLDAKSSAKHSKVGEEAGSCCNHSKNPGEAEGVFAMRRGFFDELHCGCRGATPAPGSIPSGGLRLQQIAPHHFSLACEACRPGGGARGLTMAALPKLTPSGVGKNCNGE